MAATPLQTATPQIDISSTPQTGTLPLATPTPPTEPRSDPTPAGRPILTLVIAPIPTNIPDYDRGEWRHWIDIDGDCQNARHEVLIEESVVEVTFTNERQCTVATGRWIAPFAGVVVETARSLDVDHMVPLANAHRSGGWQWNSDQKRDYANVLDYAGHLIAVTASANRSKGARGPDEWRPEDQLYWCQYAVDWVTIKSTWELSATEQEWDALDEMLDSCGERPSVELVFAATNLAPASPTPSPQPAPVATLTPTPLTMNTAATISPSSVAASELVEHALRRINEHRLAAGLTPLRLGTNDAAQVDAKLSLNALNGRALKDSGRTPAMMYNQLGGRGYVQSIGFWSGYFTEAERTRCRSPRVICDQTDPVAKIDGYYDEPKSILLERHWDTVNIGIVFDDLAFFIKEYYETDGPVYEVEPRIENGYLTLSLQTGGRNVTQLAIDGTEVDDVGKVRLVGPPPPGRAMTLPDDLFRVAEMWETQRGVLHVTADVSGLINSPGVYRILVWTDDSDSVPLGVHHIEVDDPSDLVKAGQSPIPEPRPLPIDELRQFALDLINKDRADHGAPPVKLGTNGAAQIHAEDALMHRYVGHWTVDGLKPYMLYAQAGGQGKVGENAAGGYFDDCDAPLIYCNPSSPKEAIEGHQWAMMYDDAHADWGHRDTIINPTYDTVNIGIAHSEWGTAFIQHFEYVGLEYVDEPQIERGVLRFTARVRGNDDVDAVYVYYDPPPERKTTEEIGRLTSYCTGGGFTDQCDDIEPLFRVLVPPEIKWGEGYSYADLDPNDIVAQTWDQNGQQLEVGVDVSDFVTKTGVYTLLVWTQGDDAKVLSQFPVLVGVDFPVP